MPEKCLVQVSFDLPLNQSFTYLVPEGSSLPPIGARVLAPFGHLEKKGFVVETSFEAIHDDHALKPLKKIVDTESLFGKWTLATAKWLSQHYLCSLGQALSTILPSAKRERSLEIPGVPDAADHDLVLNAEQEHALSEIFATAPNHVYLWGLTGSGKTEVFLQAARKVLDSGSQVIYLVPEVALTWPLVTTLTNRFGNRVAVLHSHLTPAQKLSEWKRIRDGKADLIVGARSAIFAPVSNLGLLIVDEEHETSYKSSHSPRYHARQVAFHLAKLTGAKIVLGSATPSLESVHAMRTGVFRQVCLKSRPAGGAMPEVRLVSMKGNSGIFSAELIEGIHKTHHQQRQTILFLNRRGFSSSFHCRTCGENLSCQNCSVSLTWHKSRNILLCHFCGWQTKPVTICPNCGSLDVGWNSVGTEKVEEEIRKIFPDLRVARIDSDTANQEHYVPNVLEAFRKLELDVLIGTQMIAKGLDFPGVKLVGILNADQGLAIPDFRSTERVWALIRQVAGRAGRFHPDGLVLVQTLRPQASVLTKASQGRDEEFWDEELQIRKELDFPPFVRLARLVIRSKWVTRAQQTAGSLAISLKTRKDFPDLDVIGPSECTIAQQAGHYRFQVLLRSRSFLPLHQSISHVLTLIRAPKGVHIEIDFDPIYLL